MTTPTTSGTYNWALSESDVISEAFERAGIRTPSLTAAHMVSARRSLNLELQTWANRGTNLWEVDLVNVPLVQGQAVYSVSSNTIDILDMYYSQPVTGSTNIDRIMEPISRDTYAAYSNKLLQGTPTVYWFNRGDNPTITIYQNPGQGSPYSINYYRVKRMQDANVGGGELPDINYRFTDALCAGMAARMAEKYNPQLEPQLAMKAKMAFQEAWAEDREKVAIMIQPQLGGYWR